MRGESVLTEQTDEEISAERVSMSRSNDRFRERARRDAEAQGRGQAMLGRSPISDELARQISLRVPVPDHEEADDGHDEEGRSVGRIEAGIVEAAGLAGRAQGQVTLEQMALAAARTPTAQTRGDGRRLRVGSLVHVNTPDRPGKPRSRRRPAVHTDMGIALR